MKLLTVAILIGINLVSCRNMNNETDSSESPTEISLQEAILIDTVQMLKLELISYSDYRFRFRIDKKLHKLDSIELKLEDNSNLSYSHFSPSRTWIIENDTNVDGFMIYRLYKDSIVSSLSVQGGAWKPLNFLWINDSTILVKVSFKQNDSAFQKDARYFEMAIY